MDAFAVIGSRNTPNKIIQDMADVAKYIQDTYNLVVRSGGNLESADRAIHLHPMIAEVFLPWDNFYSLYQGKPSKTYGYVNMSQSPYLKQALEIAKELHPNWTACSSGARKLHARNIPIILGRQLDAPVKLVLCYGKEADGKVVGGTGMGVSIAQTKGIPVFNFFMLSKEEVLEKIKFLFDRKMT